jgi:hypothetical protein
LKKPALLLIALICLAALAAVFYFTLRDTGIPDRETIELVVEKPLETPEEQIPERPAAEPPLEQPAEEPVEKAPIETVKDDGPKNLINMPAETLVSFTLIEKGRTVSLRKQNGIWVAENGYPSRFDPSKILPFINELSQIDSIKTVNFSLETGGEKGIDPASRSITISNGEKSQTIYPGAYSDEEKGYYLSLNGSDEIYLVKSTLGPALSIKPDDLRDRKISLPDITKIATLKIEGESPLHIIPYERFDQFAPENFSHMMESPYNRLVPVDSKVFMNYLNSINAPLQIIDFIDEGSPEDYGINKEPDYRLTDQTGKSLVLHTGDEAGSKKIYAKLGTEDQIFTLDETDLTFISVSPFDLADKQIRPIDPEKIDTLNITSSELSIMVTIDKRGGEKIYALNGLEISESDFTELFQAVTDLRLDGEVSALVGSGNSELSISWKLKDGGSRWARTEFIPYDNKSYAVRQYENYEPLFIIDQNKVKTMLDKVTAVADRAFGF